LQGEDLLIRRSDGNTMELSISRSVELDAEGNTVVISIGQDNSHQKALQASMQKLLESEKRFSYVVENAPISTLIINTEGTILEFNPEAERVTGYSRDQVLGKNFIKFLVAKQSRKKAVKAATNAMAGKEFRDLELVLNRANGTKVELECSSSVPAFDIMTGQMQLVAIGIDVTQKKALEASQLELLESEKRFSYVVKHAPIPILILNSKGDIVEANPEAQAASGYTETIVGKNFIELIVSAESRKKAIVTAANAMKGKEFRNVELVLQNASGERIEYECSLGSVNQHKEEGQVVAIARNVSGQKALQTSLIEAREAAESADRTKSMFIASMSHELRTPLNSIIGFLGVVLQGMSGELNLKQKDQLGRAYYSAKHLLSLISDVIDISKIEAGFLSAYVEKFDLNPLLKEVEHAVMHLVEEKQLILTIDCPAKLMLETDRRRLYQVVLNVVSNAVKYTEDGSVKVKASIKNTQLVIVVKDTGIGMDEAGLARLFKPFERIDSRLRIKTLGTGLGLYLTRKILSQLLGGVIEVESKLDAGSTFTITVPIKMPTIPVPADSISILE
jgi:PAS domain S-box-containing protein